MFNRIENLQEILSDTIEYTERTKQEIEQFKLLGEYFNQAELPELAQDDMDIYREDLNLYSLTKGFWSRLLCFLIWIRKKLKIPYV